MPGKLQVLQVVVVSGQVEVDPVLPQQRVPLFDEHRMVAMRPVRIHGMVPDHRQKRRSPRLRELPP